MTQSSTPAQNTTVTIPVAAVEAFNQANRSARAGDHQAAISACLEAIEIFSELLPAHILLGRRHFTLGQLALAKKAYLNALDQAPEDFSANLGLGNILRQEDHFAQAADTYRMAIATRPKDSRGHLALALLCQQDAIENASWVAARHYQIALDCAVREIHSEGAARIDQRIGWRRNELGDCFGAGEAFRAGLSRLPQTRGDCSALEADLNVDLAEVLFQLDLYPEAAKLLERSAQTNSTTVLRRVADCSYRHKFWQEAIAILKRAVTLDPAEASLHLALADMQVKSWLMGEAEKTLDQISRLLSPEQNYTLCEIRAQIASRSGDAEGALAQYQAIADHDVDRLASTLAMTALYSHSAYPQTWAERTRAACALWGEGARHRDSFENDRNISRPLRIGMVTPDLRRQHPVNIFLQPMLKQWNNSSFPLTVYFTGRHSDEQTRQAQSRAGQWRSLAPEQLRHAVSSDRIDILIDLSGHTHSGELKQFAQRLAPVQATYLGYSGSTEVPNIDFLIGDSVLTPASHELLYSERLMRLDTSVFCYAPEENYPSPKFDAAMRERPLTFGSFNNLPKITPKTVELWAQILQALPDARLLLKAPSFQDPAAVARIESLFSSRNISPGRLTLRGPSELGQMMQEYAEVDIGLDPMPYNGGTTTLQALWMGVPVVTKSGTQFVSRMGESFMRHVDLNDWVAQSDADYVRIAVEKARDRHALLTLKSGLRQHLLSKPSWSISALIGSFEAALKRMWQES